MKLAGMRHTGYSRGHAECLCRLGTSATYEAFRHEIHRYVCIIHTYIHINRHLADMYTYTLVH